MRKTKPWYRSKTIISNLILLVAWLIQVCFGFLIPQDIQLAITAMLNIYLRTISDEAIE